MSDYQIGDAVPLTYTISAAATVVLTVTAPDGTSSTPGLTQAGSPPTVTYSTAVAVTQAGTWLYRFIATGAVTDAEDGSFHVRPISDARVYATVPELKSQLTIPQADTVDDTELESAIRATSRQIDADCQQHFWRVTEARTLVPSDYYLLKLGSWNNLVSVTSLKTDASGDGTYETTWASTDYQLLCADDTPNINAGPELRPYTKIRAIGGRSFPIPYYWTTGRRDLVEITGTWGWPAVPEAVREACLVLAAELVKLKKEAPFGVAGFGEFGAVRVRDNPKARSLLQPYMRHMRGQVLVA